MLSEKILTYSTNIVLLLYERKIMVLLALLLLLYVSEIILKKLRQKQHEKELKKYHDLYISMYQKYIDTLNKSPHAAVKNVCIIQCRNIKQIWNKFNFDLSELTAMDPIGIHI